MDFNTYRYIGVTYSNQSPWEAGKRREEKRPAVQGNKLDKWTVERGMVSTRFVINIKEIGEK